METYREFLNRINSFEEKSWSFAPGNFKGNPSLEKKVHPNNTFRPFYGDTVVFDLDDITKERLTKWLDKLYATVPECFSEHLSADTFHVTLHDLCNSGEFSEIEKEIEANRRKIQSLCKELLTFDAIKMKSKYVFNMVNTSLVLRAKELYYQHFDSMNHYMNVLSIFGESFLKKSSISLGAVRDAFYAKFTAFLWRRRIFLPKVRK